MSKHFFGDTAVLLGRSLRHIARSPDTIITTTVMPIAIMLLLVYVFGGAIETGSGSYVNYLLPGILLMTIASGISYTAYRLFGDMQGGIFERFQSMPIARSGVLWAHVLTSLVANLISLVVVVLGFSTRRVWIWWLRGPSCGSRQRALVAAPAARNPNSVPSRSTGSADVRRDRRRRETALHRGSNRGRVRRHRPTIYRHLTRA